MNSKKVRRALGVLLFLVWFGVTGYALYLVVGPMKDLDPKPDGVVALELAGTHERAEEIVRGWRAAEVEDAREALRLDRWLIAAYVVSVSVACGWGRRALRSRRLGIFLVAGAVVAGALDLLVENPLLEDIVRSEPVIASGAPYLTLVAAAKFLLLAAGALYGLSTSAYRITLAIERYLEGFASEDPTLRLARSQVRPGKRPISGRPFSGLVGWRLRLLLKWLIGLPIRLPVPPPPPPPQPKEGELRVGICCSGGGIRSAAYNLGALQSLQQQKEVRDGREGNVLHSADYLTAVSGGSYIAASFAMMQRYSEPALPATLPAYAPGTPEEHFLRNHVAYLAPPGLAGKAWMVVRALLGIAVNLGLIAAVLFLLGRPLGWLYERAYVGLGKGGEPLEVPLWAWATVLGLVGTGALIALADALSRPVERARRLLRNWSIRLIALGAVALVFLIGFPFLVELVLNLQVRKEGPELFERFRRPVVVLNALGVTALITGGLRALLAKKRSLVAMGVGAVVGPLFLLGLFVVFLRDGVVDGYDVGALVGLLVVLGVFIVFYFLSDLTTWSPHPFYKRSLWGAFGTRRVERDGERLAEAIPYDDAPRISDAVPTPWPELVVCASVNTSDEGATPPGRNGATFTFSPRRIGSPLLGTKRMINTRRYEAALAERAGDISLIGAVAISGAALSPSMGKMTRAPIRFLMALLNLRLGVWLPNPVWIEWWEQLAQRKTFFAPLIRFARVRPRPRFLIKELMGWNHLDSKFLYVTDGGHFENLGLVELLRRGCTMIYCFDAAGDDVNTFDTLGEAVALARAELSVEIEINPDPLRPVGSDGYSSTDFVVGSFRYRNGSEGLITFAKAAITEDAPWDVRAFARKDKRFPTHGTVDQFFNEQKFEAYRALGAHTARRALAFWDRPGATPSPAQSSRPSAPIQVATSSAAASPKGNKGSGKGRFRLWLDRRRARRN